MTIYLYLILSSIIHVLKEIHSYILNMISSKYVPKFLMTHRGNQNKTNVCMKNSHITYIIETSHVVFLEISNISGSLKCLNHNLQDLQEVGEWKLDIILITPLVQDTAPSQHYSIKTYLFRIYNLLQKFHCCLKWANSDFLLN